MYNMGHNAMYGCYYLSTRPEFNHPVSPLTDMDKWVMEFVKVSSNFEFRPPDLQFDRLLIDPYAPRRDPHPQIQGESEYILEHLFIL